VVVLNRLNLPLFLLFVPYFAAQASPDACKISRKFPEELHAIYDSSTSARQLIYNQYLTAIPLIEYNQFVEADLTATPDPIAHRNVYAQLNPKLEAFFSAYSVVLLPNFDRTKITAIFEAARSAVITDIAATTSISETNRDELSHRLQSAKLAMPGDHLDFLSSSNRALVNYYFEQRCGMNSTNEFFPGLFHLYIQNQHIVALCPALIYIAQLTELGPTVLAQSLGHEMSHSLHATADLSIDGKTYTEASVDSIYAPLVARWQKQFDALFSMPNQRDESSLSLIAWFKSVLGHDPSKTELHSREMIQKKKTFIQDSLCLFKMDSDDNHDDGFHPSIQLRAEWLSANPSIQSILKGKNKYTWDAL